MASQVAHSRPRSSRAQLHLGMFKQYAPKCVLAQLHDFDTNAIAKQTVGANKPYFTSKLINVIKPVMRPKNQKILKYL